MAPQASRILGDQMHAAARPQHAPDSASARADRARLDDVAQTT